MLEAGTKSPDFRLSGLTGGELTLSQVLERGAAVVAFFKVSCPTCQFAFPYLERLAKGSLRVVAVSQDDAASTERFRKQLGLTLETALDSAVAGYPVSNAFGLTHVPSLFLIEPDGKIVFSATGFAKADFEALGRRAGVQPFVETDSVPAWKAG